MGGGGVPNSPLSWVKECVETFASGGPGSKLRSMTLIGLPFNGKTSTEGCLRHRPGDALIHCGCLMFACVPRG